MHTCMKVFVMQVHGAPHCSAIIVCFFMYGFDLPIITTVMMYF